jgi:hypothetical protein
MIITYTPSQFTLINEVYYSPAFQQDSDLFISVAISTSELTEISMQHSIDDIN